MNDDQFGAELLQFLQASPTPYHAVDNISQILRDAGFTRLYESMEWNLVAGGKYFVTRNDSSIVAFVHGQGDLAEEGMNMVGAHTDSPCLMVKPNPEVNSQGYFQLGVETYGGVLLNPWFDRDLSLAGRVSYLNDEQKICSTLIDFKKPIAVIPSLAIHLDREANKGRTINPQTHIPPVLMQVGSKTPDFRQLLADTLSQQGVQGVVKILDYELSFYDTQPPAVVGLQNEFIASARLDNLLSCFIGLQALLQADDSQSVLLVCNDHEEVGSRSACGAQGPMLTDVFTRLLPDAQSRMRCLSRSLMISADNAHGIHPNYSAQHDSNHGPLLNHGPVIKVNANQSYATNSETSSGFRLWCEAVDVPVQVFVTRTDMGCGSTIGPITSAQLGVKTIDVGVPTFAMHSIRELAGRSDAYMLYKVLTQYYRTSLKVFDSQR